MRILVADGSTSEFGWELMTWQARVRRLAATFDRTIIITTKGMEPLYADFASEYITHNVAMERDCYKAFKIKDQRGWSKHQQAVHNRVEDLKRQGHSVAQVKHDKLFKTSQQKFVKYGNQGEIAGQRYDILLHARNKESKNPYYRVYNWPLDRWNRVVDWLTSCGYRVAAVGTRNGSLLPEKADDLRNIPLEMLMNHLDACDLIIGPSSGPMHLAALCETPHFVWTGRQFSTTINAYNYDRYTSVWNPFDTWCHVVDHDPDLPADEVIEHVIKCLNEVEDTDVMKAIENPVEAMKYWRRRAARQGRDYVSRSMTNTGEQETKIREKIKPALERGFEFALDFGCRWGRFSNFLAEHCSQVYGVDLVGQFRDDLADNVKAQRIDYPVKLDLPDDSVDLVFASLVLQHILSDSWIEEIAAELRRVMKPGAAVLVIDDAISEAAHVRPRKPKAIAYLLGLNEFTHEPFSLDSDGSHYYMIGTASET